MCTAGALYRGTCSTNNGKSNPVEVAYSRGIEVNPVNCYDSYPSWDPITALAAIVGPTKAMMAEQPGTDYVDIWGHETWNSQDDSNNEANLSYENNYRNELQVEELLDEILCASYRDD